MSSGESSGSIASNPNMGDWSWYLRWSLDLGGLTTGERNVKSYERGRRRYGGKWRWVGVDEFALDVVHSSAISTEPSLSSALGAGEWMLLREDISIRSKSHPPSV